MQDNVEVPDMVQEWLAHSAQIRNLTIGSDSYYAGIVKVSAWGNGGIVDWPMQVYRLTG